MIGGVAVSGQAQNETDSKLSITTQMFLQEQKGELSFDRNTAARKKPGLHPVEHARVQKDRRSDNRFYAAPDTIDGKAYIAAYLRLADASAVSDVEALGVVLQEEFNNGLWTSLIPVDKINEVAAVSNVRRINVSPLKMTLTNAARQMTNTDDALTLSTDAIAAGLKQKYDGTGVVLGIIDTGIDFNHIAFKDASGNSRIKQAYVYNGSKATTYTGSQITSTLTDDNTGDHGTHTSSTAGGSSVIVSGTTVTVTDDHANATYGGMAPGADLYLAGIKGLTATYLSNAVKAMCTYADNQGKPLVVSNSWGGQVGPHDGTGDEADVYNSLFGDSHPNRVALFAASNDAGNGGYHLKGTASSSNPLRSILRCHYYSDTDDGFYYDGIIANAWARSTSVSSMTCKIYVLNSSTGAVLKTISVTPSTNGTTVSGLSSYYSGSLYVYKDYVTSDKTQVMLYANELESKSYDSNYNSNYTLAVEFAPSSGSCVIDVWGGNAGAYFTNHLTTSGYTWTAGTDDGSYSDEATIANVIPIGAYVSKTDWTDYNGSSHSMADTYTMGDIAYFSSWGTAANNPVGAMIPWISAPGARLAAGINHNHTSSVDSYSYWGSYFKEDLVVNNSTNPYAMMEGTSMATPTAAGIVALWMQASLDANAQHKDLTVNDVKTIMKETAITDAYTTTGANKDHFGNGKIDALAGIKYILGSSSEPAIRVSANNIAFAATTSQLQPQTRELTVNGFNLDADISITLSDATGAFSIDTPVVAVTDGTASATVTITWTPAEADNYEASLLLESTGADPVTVALTAMVKDLGSASDPFLNIARYATIDEAGWDKTYVNTLYKYTRDEDAEVAWLTMPLYGAWSSVYYSPNAQKWIESSLGTSNTYAGVDWASNDVFPGSSAYFTGTSGNGRARAMGYNNGTTTDLKAVTFYVTNTTGIKASGLGRSGVSSSYPAALKVYECTVNADGSLTAATTVAKSATSTSTSTSTPFVISIDALDAAKVYKVEASIYRGYMYEIGFQTPIEVDKTPQLTVEPAELAFETPLGVEQVKQLAIKGKYLTSPVTIECDTEAFQLSTEEITAAEANAGATVDVSFTTTEMGEQTGTLTLSTEGVEPITVSLTATPLQPTLNVEPSSLTFSTIEAGLTTQASFTVTGANLASGVQTALTDDNGVFVLSEDDTYLSGDELAEGKSVTVTFAPAAAGTYEGSIELTSNHAEPVIVTLTATATAPVPTITASETALAFSGSTDTDITKTFVVSGRALTEDIAVTLTDPKHVFSVSAQSVEATSEGSEITVTFNSAEEGDFTGSITLSSEGAADVTIGLTASAMNGGTASDPYLNIAKYATIDEAGWNTSLVDNIYKYTEDEENEVAWLTLPVYGALVGAKYATNSASFNSGQPQKWVETTVSQTNQCGSTTWGATDVLVGSSSYFTSASAMAVGTNSQNSKTAKTMTFYVTNTTAVKLYISQRSTSLTYPTTLNIYECSLNDDGSVTASSQATKSESRTTSGAGVLSATDLDASKIYKVVASQARGYLYEIAFQTPLKKATVIIGDVNRDGVITIADVTAIVNIILGKETADDDYDHAAADVNADTTITIADVTALVNIILGK